MWKRLRERLRKRWRDHQQLSAAGRKRICRTYSFLNDRDPLLPARLSGVVQLVAGLENVNVRRPGWRVRRCRLHAGLRAGARMPGGRSRPMRTPTRKRWRLLPPAWKRSRKLRRRRAACIHQRALLASTGYDYQALNSLGHCCNPLNNPGSSPPVSSLVIAAYGDVSYSDLAAFKQAFPYLTYNVQEQLIDGYTCNNAPKTRTKHASRRRWTRSGLFPRPTARTCRPTRRRSLCTKAITQHRQTTLDELNYIAERWFCARDEHQLGRAGGPGQSTIKQENAEDNVLTEMAARDGRCWPPAAIRARPRPATTAWM